MFYKNIYKYLFILSERERESMSGGKREGGREREKEREGIPSRLRTVSTEPDVGFKPTNSEIMTYTDIKNQMLGVPRWLSQLSVQLWLQLMISRLMSWSPASGSVLTAQSSEPASDSTSPSLSLPLLSLFLSLKNK